MSAGALSPDRRGQSVPVPFSLPRPREYGAWVMLYALLVLGLIAGRTAGPIAAVLLILAVTFVFFAQEPARLLIRRRGDAVTPRWAAFYGLLAAATGLPLLWISPAGPALTMTGLVAVVIIQGRPEPGVSWTGSACGLFFASSIFALKLLLGSARFRSGLSLRERWQIGKAYLLFHPFDSMARGTY